MKTEKEFIGEIRTHLSNATTQRPKMKRTKLMGKVSPIGIGLFVCAIAGAMLIGSLYTLFYVNIEGDIELNGTEVPLFFWDDTVPFTGQYCNRTVDVTTLDAGDKETFGHSVTNADMGYWYIDFNLTQVTFTDPLDKYYGFYFSVENPKVDGVPCTLEELIIAPTQKATFDFVYELDHEFVSIDVPLFFNISSSITRYEGVLVYNDTFNMVGENGNFDPLLNDIDCQLVYQGLHITEVDEVTGGATQILIDPSGVSVNIYMQSPGVAVFSYRAETNTTGISNVGYITVTRTT